MALQNKTRAESFGSIEYSPLEDKFFLQTALDEETLNSRKLSAPLTLHWILTLKCNARCPYCYELPNLLKPSDKEETLAISDLEIVMEELKKNKVFRLYLTGGEPTLSPLLPEILRRAYRQGMKTVVNTNGIRISEETYASLKTAESRLSFSLDSHLREDHDLIRKQKSYQNIVQMIQRGCAEGVDVRVISVLQSRHLDYYQRFGNFLTELGVKYWFLQKETEEKRQEVASSELQQQLREKFPSMYIRVLPAIFDSFLYLLPNGDMGAHWWTAKRKKYGNILEESLSELWQMHPYTSVEDHRGILQVRK